jgi:hypothetical protein
MGHGYKGVLSGAVLWWSLPNQNGDWTLGQKHSFPVSHISVPHPSIHLQEVTSQRFCAAGESRTEWWPAVFLINFQAGLEPLTERD